MRDLFAVLDRCRQDLSETEELDDNLRHYVVLRILDALDWTSEDVQKLALPKGCDGVKCVYGLGPVKQCRILVVVSDNVAANYDCILKWWREKYCDNPDNEQNSLHQDDESMSLLYVVVTDGVCWRIHPVARGGCPTEPQSVDVRRGAQPVHPSVAETAVPYEEWAILPSENADYNLIVYSFDLHKKFAATSCFYLLRLWKSLAMESGNSLDQLMKKVGLSAGTKSKSCWVKCIDLPNDDYATKTPTRLRLNDGDELSEKTCTSWSKMYVTLAKWLEEKDILTDDCLDKDVTVYRSEYEGIAAFTEPIGNGVIIRHASAQQLQDYTERLLRLVEREKGVNVDGYEVCLEEKGK